MKKILFTLGIILLCGYLFCQNENHIDSRLKQVFSEEYLNNLSANYPDELEYLNWCLDNSYDITEVDNDKYISLPYLKYFNPISKTVGENVEYIDLENFNVFLYSFERSLEYGDTYRIGNTNKIIHFHSYKHLTKTFNALKGYEN